MPESNPSTYRSLIEKRAELDAEIKEVRKTEMAAVIAQIKSLVAEYDIKSGDIFTTAKTAVKAVAPKYKDPASGATWTGRGKAPAWTKSVNLNDCRIAA